LLVVLGALAALLGLAGTPLAASLSHLPGNPATSSGLIGCATAWHLTGGFQPRRAPAAGDSTISLLEQQLNANLSELIVIEDSLSEQPLRQSAGDVERWYMLRTSVQQEEARLAAIRFSPTSSPVEARLAPRSAGSCI
jgi:hypothetical protein